MAFEKGWINRQFAHLEREAEKWPDWMRRQSRVREAGSSARFQIRIGSNGQFMFSLKAGNGEVILTGGQYKDREACRSDINSVRLNVADDARFIRQTASDGQHYFVLTAANGTRIGKSEMYQAQGSMENGIASVKRSAPGAMIEDTVGTQ